MTRARPASPNLSVANTEIDRRPLPFSKNKTKKTKKKREKRKAEKEREKGKKEENEERKKEGINKKNPTFQHVHPSTDIQIA